MSIIQHNRYLLIFFCPFSNYFPSVCLNGVFRFFFFVFEVRAQTCDVAKDDLGLLMSLLPSARITRKHPPYPS